MSNAKELKELSSSMNILYAEDESILRDGMGSTLEKFFNNTFIAKHGQEAFEIFKKEDIDIILTDINMPIMDGVELITQINKMDTDVIIIVLSAHDESRLLKTLINLGINNFLNKPVEKDALINILYKNCSIIHTKRLVDTCSRQLKEEYDALSRKNVILEQKVKQLASYRNKAKDSGKQVEKNEVNENYYETLLIEDKEELRDLSTEFDTYILMMFQNQNSINTDYIDKLSSVYKKYASILNSYSDFHEISNFLFTLGRTIVSLENKFLEDIDQSGIYLESLQFTLESFRQNVWEKEAQDPTFYNASLTNDIQIILSFLEGEEIEENDIEFF